MPSPQEAKTLNDAIDIICRLIVYMGGIAAAVTGIWALITKIKSKGSVAKMQGQINELSGRVDDHEERLGKIEQTFEDNRVELQDLHEVSRLTLSAVQQLLKSGLEDGNNHAGMQKASDEIDEYLKSKI